ncbi:hypothetical protein [Bradyrhizobium neotropicale]|uniref:hypothetical protein n=1 Tax=Bradyrhizobium neotropicale TaxID=1497615 RepID=UPI001AD6570C|nr:hypothetical protein [Bradyrhizobium neotropicale]MBO4220948.1 hypothetical protein [Bradyrhizobium neotropicale]
MYYVANIMRSKGDPKIVRGGPSSIEPADRLARRLGWFSIGLGAMEVLASRRITRALGMRGSEGLVRAYGFRELFSGVMSLSVDKRAGMWSRVAGDGLDAATLLSGFRYDNPKKHNVALALLMVGGIAFLDYKAALQTVARSPKHGGRRRLYADRTGFPKGLEAARSSAKNLLGRAAVGAS